MRIGKLKLVLVILCCVALAYEVWHLRPGSHAGQRQTVPVLPKHRPRFVLLPATEIANYAGLSADAKPHMENWEPTVADINDLEANLSQIAALSSTQPDPNQHIDDPGQYFRQYLAVAVNGKKSIFVNALCNVEPGEGWRKHLILVMDGGKCYWNAAYDPATQKFSNLVVNGRG
jgi:hypothetical protein